MPSHENSLKTNRQLILQLETHTNKMTFIANWKRAINYNLSLIRIIGGMLSTLSEIVRMIKNFEYKQRIK
jgi:hypothetical protein